MRIKIKPKIGLFTSYDFPAVELCFSKTEVGHDGLEVGIEAEDAIKIGVAGENLKKMIAARRKSSHE